MEHLQAPLAAFVAKMRSLLCKIRPRQAPNADHSGAFAVLPREIIQRIAEMAEPEAAAALIFTCKHLKGVIGTESWLILKRDLCHRGPIHKRGICRKCIRQRRVISLMGRDVDPRKATVCSKHGIIHIHRPFWKRLLTYKRQCREGTIFNFGLNRIFLIETQQKIIKGYQPVETTEFYTQLEMPRLKHGGLEHMQADFTSYAKVIDRQLIEAMQIRIQIPSSCGFSPKQLQGLLKEGYYWPVGSPFEALEIRLPHSGDDNRPLSSHGKLRLNSFYPAFLWCHSRRCFLDGCYRGVNCVRDYRTVQVEPFESTGVQIKIDMFINLGYGYIGRLMMEEASPAHLLAARSVHDIRSRVQCPEGSCSMCRQKKYLEKIVESEFNDHEMMLTRAREYGSS